MNQSLIIAEAGVNHNGDPDLAFKLIDAASRAGADIVKFQTFKAKNLVTKDAEQCDYQIANTGKKESQYSMLKRLELNYELHFELRDYCNKKGIEFLSTAFDEESLDFLVNDLGLTRLKLPSGEITNAPLILAHARTGCDIILSTGMANLSEIEMALGVIAFGYLTDNDITPSSSDFEQAYTSEAGQKILKEKVIILHCTTEYPAPIDEINLQVMNTLSSAFNLSTGYSDHSSGITIPIAAVSRGAVLVEKHFTLDKTLPGPDHKASLDPTELTAMVKAIRDVELAIGNGVKSPTMSELKNRKIARKSIVAKRAVNKGERFTSENLEVKRPGGGMSPFLLWRLLTTNATKGYAVGELIEEKL